MKKLSFIFLLIIFSFETSYSNPIPYYPSSVISEFMYDDNNNWILELFLDGYIDSMFICTSLLKSKVNINFNDDSFQREQYLVIKENDGTTIPFSINQAGDSLTLIVYYEHTTPSYNYLVFGNYRNSMVGSPQEGQSIILLETGFRYTPTSDVSAKYAKCSQPSIGDYNNSSFALGTIKGKIYKSGAPYIDDRLLTLSNGESFNIDAEGNYEAKIYANIMTYDTIRGREYSWSTPFRLKAPIEKFSLNMEPLAIVEQDIYLLNDLTVSIEQTQAEDISILSLYPNPATENINYEIKLPVISTNSHIEILNSNGQIVVQQPITTKKGTINLPIGIGTGTYVASLIVNGKKYTTSKIMISK